MTETPSSIIPDLVSETVLAKELGCSRRTLARYRGAGSPYARVAGKIFIHREGARAYFEKQTIGLPKKRRGK